MRWVLNGGSGRVLDLVIVVPNCSIGRVLGLVAMGAEPEEW